MAYANTLPNFVRRTSKSVETLSAHPKNDSTDLEVRRESKASATRLLRSLVLILALLPTTTALALDDSRRTESWPEGFTQPIATVHLAASESGVIDRILVREGDHVQAGDTIAQLRCEVLQATRQATLAKLNSTGQRMAAVATLAHRENHLTQLKALRDQSHASEQEVAEAEFNVRLAEAQLQTADENAEVLKAELLQIEAQIVRRKIRAPIAGIVSELPVQAGERVGADDKPVAELVCLDQLRIRYYLPTAIASSLAVGDSRAIYFPEADRSHNAIVDFVAPTTDSSSGTVRVELLIENQAGEFRAGVRCRLELDTQNDHEQFASLLRLRVPTLPMKTIAHRSPHNPALLTVLAERRKPSGPAIENTIQHRAARAAPLTIATMPVASTDTHRGSTTSVLMRPSEIFPRGVSER